MSSEHSSILRAINPGTPRGYDRTGSQLRNLRRRHGEDYVPGTDWSLSPGIRTAFSSSFARRYVSKRFSGIAGLFRDCTLCTDRAAQIIAVMVNVPDLITTS